MARDVERVKKQILRLRLPRGHCMSTGPQAAPLRMTASWFGALGLPKESTEYWVEVVNSWAWDLAFAKACSDFGEVTQLAAAATFVRFFVFCRESSFQSRLEISRCCCQRVSRCACHR